MNPVELGQGTFPLSEAATDRFAAMVHIGYLPPDEEEKLVDFDFKRMTLRPLLSKQRIIELRGLIGERVFLHKSLGRYVQRLVGGHPAAGRRHRLAAALAVGAGRARRRPGRVAAGDHLLEPAGQGLGAAAGRARRGLSRGHPGAGARSCSGTASGSGRMPPRTG